MDLKSKKTFEEKMLDYVKDRVYQNREEDELKEREAQFKIAEDAGVGPFLATVGKSNYHLVFGRSPHNEAVLAVRLFKDRDFLGPIGFFYAKGKNNEHSIVVSNVQGEYGKQAELKEFARLMKAKHFSHALINALKEFASKTGVKSIYGMPKEYVERIRTKFDNAIRPETFAALKPKGDLGLVYNTSFKKTGFKRKPGEFYHLKLD